MQRDKIFGIKPVIEVLRAGRPVQRVLIAEQRQSDREVQEIIRLARGGGIEVRMTTRDALNREAPNALHQGVLAVVAAREYATLDDILKIPSQKKQSPLFLVLDGVEDPRNLGAILRTAEVAGVHGVILPERRAAGLTETAAKTAAGAVEYVPVVKVVNIVNTLEELKKCGVWIAGADAGGDLVYWDADFITTNRDRTWRGGQGHPQAGTGALRLPGISAANGEDQFAECICCIRGPFI